MLGSTGAHRFSAALGPTGDFRLRNAITTLKAMLGAFALFSASAGIAAPYGGTDGAQPLSNAVVQADVLPSIEILPKQLNLAGRCNGLAFDLNTFINTTSQTSANVRVSSSKLNPSLLEQFTDNTGANVGVFNANYPNFHILGFGGGLAPNTPITITITTYTGPNLTGTATFTGAGLHRPRAAGNAGRNRRRRGTARAAACCAAIALGWPAGIPRPGASSARGRNFLESPLRSKTRGLDYRLAPGGKLLGEGPCVGRTGRRQHADHVARVAP